MTFLCFVLDLLSLSPSLLYDLKQCLRQLSNQYAISKSQSESLRDLIGLCCVYKSHNSRSVEFKVAYTPTKSFNLRDFHRAVNSLPDDSFSPNINDAHAVAVGGSSGKLSCVLSNLVLFSWDQIGDVPKKVIYLSSCMPDISTLEIKNSLMEASARCVLVDFIVFESSSSCLFNMQEIVDPFRKNICSLDNCSLRVSLPDFGELHGLVELWLMNLEEERFKTVRAEFNFNPMHFGTMNKLKCNLSMSVHQIFDGLDVCKTCRCHGVQIDSGFRIKKNVPACSVTGEDLEQSSMFEHCVIVGENTILFFPFSQESTSLKGICSSVAFDIIERTNLTSLSEGLLIGYSFFVSPFAYSQSSPQEIQRTVVNYQIFQAINTTLHSMDQGLVCSSYCNLDTMAETDFKIFYLLLPSGDGSMLIRRLAGSEELKCIPSFNHGNIPMSSEIQYSIQNSLLQMDLRDYNPLLHERGIHRKLNLLVEESLPFGSSSLELQEPNWYHDSTEVAPETYLGIVHNAHDEESHKESDKIPSTEVASESDVGNENKAHAEEHDPDKIGSSEVSPESDAGIENKAHEKEYHHDSNNVISSDVVPQTDLGIEHRAQEKENHHDSSELNSSEVASKSDLGIKRTILKEEYPPNSSQLASDEPGDEIKHKVQEVSTKDKVDDITTCIAEEWEQLVVNQVLKTDSPTALVKFVADESDVSPSCGHKPLDEKTSRILERLEVPKQLKRKVFSPVSSDSATTDGCAVIKTLIKPQRFSESEPIMNSSQLIKPSFQKIRRKLK